MEKTPANPGAFLAKLPGGQDHRHMAFAHGIHYCLGASLARLEGQIAINTLISRMPDIQLDTGDLKRNPSTILRGLKALPVAF